MAAVDADEAAGVEPRLDDADGQRAEQLGLAVEDIGVMRIGVDGDDVLDRHEMDAAVALHRQLPGDPPRRPAGAAERSERALADGGAGAGAGNGSRRRLAGELIRFRRCRPDLGGVACAVRHQRQQEDAGHDEGDDGDDDRQQVGRQHRRAVRAVRQRRQGQAGHGRVVHAGDGHAEGGRRQQERRLPAAPARQPERQSGAGA